MSERFDWTAVHDRIGVDDLIRTLNARGPRIARAITRAQGDEIAVQRDFGARADGRADDTGAVQRALDEWISRTNKPILRFEPGRYRLTEGLLSTFTANESTSNKRISGYGAELYCDFASGWGWTITTSGLVNVRYLTIDGLTFRGVGSGDTLDGMFLIDGGNVANAALHRFVLRDLDFEQFMGDGVLFTNNAYEAQLYSCNSQPSTSNTTGTSFHFTSPSSGLVSSVDLYGCMTDRGGYGIYAETPMIGVKVYGGTYLQSAANGINCENAREAWCYGVHVENAWQSGTADPGWGTSQAGIQLSGYGGAVGCYGTDSTSKMRYVVRGFANPVQTYIGGTADGTVDYYLRAEGAASCRINTFGLSAGATGTVHNGLPASGTLIELGSESVAPDAAYTVANLSTDRAYDADATSTAELADVLGTLIADLRAKGLVT